ncbi:MAG: glycoside hydrolase family 16 protein [Flavobacteriaceae bacterium]|nr:glycoside hydrolase family 16 protein [Flavobacteriaceae bacterium]
MRPGNKWLGLFGWVGLLYFTTFFAKSDLYVISLLSSVSVDAIHQKMKNAPQSPCEFEAEIPNLNKESIDFECRGNPFLPTDAIGEIDNGGSWGRFGRKPNSPDNYLDLQYVDNPYATGINNSKRVLSVIEQPGIESWAGFFFNLESKVLFPNEQNAISIEVFSKEPGQNVLLKLEDSSNPGLSSESQVSTRLKNSWEKLIYNFPTSDTNRFDRITLIMDLGKANQEETIYYIDNIEFSSPKLVSEDPINPAPKPRHKAENVLSIFSDKYIQSKGVNLNPQWGQNTQVEFVSDSLGESVIKYTKLNYQGAEFAPIKTGIDLSKMTHLHIDYYVVSAVDLNFNLISTDPTVESAYDFPTEEKKSWISLDIPLSKFSENENGVDLSKIFQFKLEETSGVGSGSVIYLDNIYFYRTNELELLWADEFDAQSINMNYWTFELGDGCPNLCGWGNQEYQIYTEENLRIVNGILVIEARKTPDGSFTSARIKTEGKKEFLYGRIEAKIKLPKGEGLWPAFWMLGANIREIQWPDCGEIDIMEYVGRQPGVVHNAVHTRSSYFNTQNKKATTIPSVEDDFHLYSINWTPEAIEFYFDDRMTYRYAPQDKNEFNYPFDKPMFLLLNFAIGGNFGGPVGDNVQFPQQYLIDYVRVYSHKQNK